MINSFKTEQLDVGFDFDIRLEENQQVYCFIGKNGIGKTQLLENMAKSLISTHSMFKPKSEQLKYGGMFFQKNIYEKLKHIVLKLPFDTELNNIKIKDKNRKLRYFETFENINCNYNNSFICDKPLIFIGAKNRGFTKNLDTNNVKILSDEQGRFVESFSRTLKYIQGEGLEQEEVADWFVSRLIIDSKFVTKSQNKKQEAVTVLKLLDRLEPELNLVTEDENGEPLLKLMFSEGKLLINDIPLDKLSTGHISVIKIFQEIVAGYSGWTNEENLNEVDGIVFIDEIEPHLHISWQTKIIKVLRDFFPKTTFYISTHSPLVLAGLKSGEGYELVREGDVVKSKPINNIENYFLNDIVEKFFDVDLSREKIDNVDKVRQKKAKEMLLKLATTWQEDEE